MGKYLKKFDTTSQYNAYTADTANFIKPNVSLITETNTVEYNPYVPETMVVAKYNVTDTSSPTPIGFNQYTSGFSAIEIDGVKQPSVVSAYTFNTTGEHTVKYTLADPTSIGMEAFAGCDSLTSIDIPSGVTSIGDYAFVNCTRFTSIDIPNGVTTIGSGVFQGCTSLTSCTIGSGVTSIGTQAFIGCSSLTSVTIGSGVTSIGDYAFNNCTNLTSIVSNATTAPTIQNSTFNGVKANGTLTVPSGSTGYDVWMGTGNFYLGKYNWTKVEQ